MTWLFGLIAVVLVVFVVGILLAAQPGYYVKGALALIPTRAQPRAAVVFKAIGTALRWWLLAKLVAMLIVGLATWLGLWWLDVKGAAALGVTAAVLTFIPNFGPIISAVPAVLLALLEGPMTAVWVVLLFTGIQLAESYVITPRLQSKRLRCRPRC